MSSAAGNPPPATFPPPNALLRSPTYVDASAGLSVPVLVDFSRQKRIGHGRSGGADQIQNAAAPLRDHHIRRGESTNPDPRAFGQLFDEIDDGLVAALGGESGRRAVGR